MCTNNPPLWGGFIRGGFIRGGKSAIPLIVNLPNRWGMWGVGVHVKINLFLDLIDDEIEQYLSEPPCPF